MQAHRFMWELFNGPIPEGMQIDHLCFNPGCVRYDHLELVTPRENVLRSSSPAAMNAGKTHCKHGHEFTPANTRQRDNKRYCRACARQWQREKGSRS
jgi:hypothetical protein